MIGGRRAATTAIVVALAVGIGFGLRSPDASRADAPGEAARLASLRSGVAAADGALERLEAVLGNAIDHARRGTARTVAGEEPEPELTAAAEVALAGADTANAARRALRDLVGVASAVAPGTSVAAISFDGTELQLIAAQLTASAEAATVFVERRHATEAVVEALADGLAALDRDDPRGALESLAAAEAPLAALAAWAERPPLLRHWMTVSGDLLDAARDIATAAIDRDPVALEVAAERYATASEAAQGADNALAFALSEAGSAVSATPLQRLARAAGEVGDLRAALQSLPQPAS
jgi:hypothetical protein